MRHTSASHNLQVSRRMASTHLDLADWHPLRGMLDLDAQPAWAMAKLVAHHLSQPLSITARCMRRTWTNEMHAPFAGACPVCRPLSAAAALQSPADCCCHAMLAGKGHVPAAASSEPAPQNQQQHLQPPSTAPRRASPHPPPAPAAAAPVQAADPFSHVDHSSPLYAEPAAVPAQAGPDAWSWSPAPSSASAAVSNIPPAPDDPFASVFPMEPLHAAPPSAASTGSWGDFEGEGKEMTGLGDPTPDATAPGATAIQVCILCMRLWLCQLSLSVLAHLQMMTDCCRMRMLQKHHPEASIARASTSVIQCSITSACFIMRCQSLHQHCRACF